MSSEELTRTLGKLQANLADSPQLDEKALQSLRLVLDDIQTAIERTAVSRDIEPGEENTEQENASMSSRLQGLIDDFEAKHPNLTLTLSQIADRLAEMGI